MSEVEIGTAYASAIVEPECGRRVVFEVRLRSLTYRKRDGWRAHAKDAYVVGLKGSDGEGFGHHYKFERAVASMLYRARRYEKAYSVPRGVVADTRAVA